MRLANATLDELDLPTTVSRTGVKVITADPNPYGVAAPETTAAMRWLARTEGIIADPVYEGKALRGLIELIRGGVLGGGERVLLLHLGGRRPSTPMPIKSGKACSTTFQSSGFAARGSGPRPDRNPRRCVRSVELAPAPAAQKRRSHLALQCSPRSRSAPPCVGKPEPVIFDVARYLLGDCHPVAIIGDNVDAHSACGKRVGLTTILVLSGTIAQERLAAAALQPELVLPIAALVGEHRQ